MMVELGGVWGYLGYTAAALAALWPAWLARRRRGLAAGLQLAWIAAVVAALARINWEVATRYDLVGVVAKVYRELFVY